MKKSFSQQFTESVIYVTAIPAIMLLPVAVTKLQAFFN